VRTGSRPVSDQFVERLAERRSAIRRVRLRTVAVVALVLALVAGGVYVVFYSPVLAVDEEQIEVTGAGDLVDAQEVHELAAAHTGEPLARVDTGALTEQIGALVGVLEVHVRRDWPRGLEVVITPREPVAGVPADEGYLILDDQAVELATQDEPPQELPVVDVPLDSEGSAAALQAVVAVLGDLPADLFTEVAVASAASADQVEFELAGGQQVIWGSAEESELKAEVLQTLLQVPAAVYDVSAPRNPITRES